MSKQSDPSSRSTSWKSGQDPRARSKPAAPRWRKGEGRSALPGPSSRWPWSARVGLTVTVGTVAAGLFIWLVSWLQPLPRADVALFYAGYQETLALPHNAYGLNGVLSLRTLLDTTRKSVPPGLRPLQTAPVMLTGEMQIADELKLSRASAPLTILVLALHGASDGKGPFLYLDRELTDAPPAKLYLRDLIHQLRDLAPRRFLLVLDATQSPAFPRFGVLHNDFAEKLQGLGNEIKAAENLVVISASGTNQRSWVSEYWRTTSFAHYLTEGLSGVKGNFAGNRIDAKGLFDYVERNVQRWAFYNRQAAQTPILIPDDGRRARSFVLTSTPRIASATVPVGPSTEAIPKPWRATWESAWDDYQGLATGLSRAIDTPLLWRRYRDRLVRYDQLVRANDAKAPAAKRVLDGLRDKLRAGSLIPLGSSMNSLAMTAAEGPPPADPSRAQADFNALWARPSSVKDGEPAARQANRWAFTQLLYRRLRDDPSPENLKKAAGLIPDLTAVGRPRPAEIHFLSMLALHAPADPIDRPAYHALLAKALKVRAHAERAALGVTEADPGALGLVKVEPAFSERVAPWVAPLVVQADQSRRRGEDLLFANDLTSWEQAGKLLDTAEQLYSQADSSARLARQAIVACDRAQADLPVYAKWVAALPPKANPADDPASRVKTLLNLAQAVAARLTPVEPMAANPGELDTLRKDTLDLTAGMTALEQDFQKAGGEDNYASVAASLLTPFPASVADRELLAKRLVELSPESVRATLPSGTGIAAVQQGADESTRFAERRLELLSSALLGDDWTTADAAPAEPVGPSSLPQSTGDGTRSFEKTTASAADGIGARWQAMPNAVNRWVESADLARADRISRRLPGGTDSRLDEPSRDYRVKLLRDLLTAQAQRTLSDHWFGQDAEPYYQTAGLAYLKDVRDLDPKSKERGAASATLAAALGRVERLELERPQPLVVTSETRAAVEFRLRIPEGSRVPEGFPVVWLSREQDGLLSTDPGSEVRKRLEVLAATGRNEKGFSSPSARFRVGLDLELTRKFDADPEQFRRPEQRKSLVTLDGFYRGQSLRGETSVTFHPVPDTVVVREPLPTRGKVAVSAEPGLVARFGEGGGSVAIVLDCSGSMAAVTERTPEGAPATTKYQEATAALRQLLGRVSPGTVVSLWVFGEAIGPSNDAENAEQTILRVREPTAWNPSQLDELMLKVESPKLQPWNNSPIVRTMLSARDDLLNAEGFKTLLVLTDGKDNRFEKDFEINRAKKDIPSALRDAFASSDIEINVIGYKLADAEEVEARAQFKVIEEMAHPGKFFSVKDASLLAATLGQALRPSLRCSVETIDNTPRAMLTVSRAGENDRWSEPGLPAQGYKLVARAGRREERELIINRGDLLLLRLGEEKGALTIDRALFSNEKTAEERENGWRLSLVRNGRTGKSRDGLALSATLEKLPNPKERQSALEMVKPREVWWEVSAEGTAGETYTQRWARQIGLPAPCWGVSVPSWPNSAGSEQPARPTLRSWWDPDQEASFATEVVRLADFGSTDEIPAREVRVGNRSVFIDSVKVEPRRVVEISPGVFKEKSCLVVRLRHEAGDPFWVRPRGLQSEWAEHRFYSRANAYTGIFWPVTQDQKDVALTGLGLISLAEFKARAERRGYRVERKAPGSPDARDTGPNLITFDDPGSEPLGDIPPHPQ